MVEVPIEHAAEKDERLARLQLARSHKIGPKRFASLIERFGSAQRALKDPGFIRQRVGKDWRPASLSAIKEEGKALNPNYSPVICFRVAGMV